MDSHHSHRVDSISIFQEACDRFQSSLSDRQRQQFKRFPDATSMLRSIEAEVKHHPVHKSLLTLCCKKISALSEKLSPFFKVIDILVSSHAEFAAIAWGSVRLVFMLGTNYAEFLERVCELFEAMAMKLPAYQEYYDNINAVVRRRGSQAPSRLLKGMGYIYADLIQFCYDICQIFSRQRSKFLFLRGSFVHSLSRSLFSPFDVRYDSLLRRWDQHQKLVELEMELLANKEQTDTLLKVESMLGQFIIEGGVRTEQNRSSPEEQRPRANQASSSVLDPPSHMVGSIRSHTESKAT
ncbi:hypothetical protein B0I35DRAFT_442341 [Stachybotrys elegans]|uniref:DUF7708 domain-containing protein n=1 Tax=Stachybotrys elegans TaxID=80388 RepID=A0A8K0SI11_9HYPO|nr:hypothetical protein B0I35DRAFT_442341 [Stachybotrys elegans]